jgi:hypothetical protein
MISIYYTARFVGKQLFAVSGKVNDFPPVDGAQAFRWVPVKDLHPDMFTLPIDKKVAIMLQKDELPDIK